MDGYLIGDQNSVLTQARILHATLFWKGGPVRNEARNQDVQSLFFELLNNVEMA